ncbi:MAG: preprotein translocase subunit SecG [Intestinimonas sp.]|jgi:preprotein translocase subunit SecG|nr:preprotein translocase subunit SecG [Intestinimonas sp.]
MSTPKLVLTVIQVVIAVILCAVVLLQSGKTAGIAGAIGGGMDTFLSKNKAKSWDAKLAKWTKWIAIVFMVMTLVIGLM